MYTVIRDTKEKEDKGWFFSKDGSCDGMERQGLETGDYTLKGWEDYLCIERKGCVSEFAQNINQTRFENELRRMSQFQFPFLFLEFSMYDIMRFPAQLPYKIRRKIKVTSFYILQRICEIWMKYPNIKIVFCGNHGKSMARSLFKRLIENYE